MNNHLIDTLTNPQAALGTGGTVAVLNTIGSALPTVINYLVAVYTVLLIVHKGYQMYSEWKKKDKDESS